MCTCGCVWGGGGWGGFRNRDRRFALVEESRGEGNKPLIPLDTFDGNGGVFLLCHRGLGGGYHGCGFYEKTCFMVRICLAASSMPAVCGPRKVDVGVGARSHGTWGGEGERHIHDSQGQSLALAFR